MRENGIDAIPFQHPQIQEWRNNFLDVRHHHTATNLIIAGAIDDLWINSCGEVIVVDYKATARKGDVTLEASWQTAYKRQMEIYQWLLRRQGLRVSNTGYFVYCNGGDADAFDGRIEFSVKLLPYNGNDGWVDTTLIAAKRCLINDAIPVQHGDCECCGYAHMRGALGVVDSSNV